MKHIVPFHITGMILSQNSLSTYSYRLSALWLACLATTSFTSGILVLEINTSSLKAVMLRGAVNVLVNQDIWVLTRVPWILRQDILSSIFGGNKALLLNMEYLKLEQARPGGIGLSHGCLVAKARRSQDGGLLLLVLQRKLKASLKSETLSQNRK